MMKTLIDLKNRRILEEDRARSLAAEIPSLDAAAAAPAQPFNYSTLDAPTTGAPDPKNKLRTPMPRRITPEPDEFSLTSMGVLKDTLAARAGCSSDHASEISASSKLSDELDDDPDRYTLQSFPISPLDAPAGNYYR